MRLQRRLAKLSPQGRLFIAYGSGHDIQADRAGLGGVDYSVTSARGVPG
jgi:hypothetical protein